MKHIKQMIVSFSLLLFAFAFCTIPAKASDDPLSKMRTTEKAYIKSGRMISDKVQSSFDTPVYAGDVSIKVKSSNTSVMTASSTTINMGDEENPEYFARFYVYPKKSGKATLTVTVTVNGKKYKEKCKYYFRKYTNPVSSLKVGKTNYAKKLAKKPHKQVTNNYYFKKAKASYKMRRGFKATKFAVFADTYGPDFVKIKNGTKIPSSTIAIKVYYKKDGYKGMVMIYSDDFNAYAD